MSVYKKLYLITFLKMTIILSAVMLTIAGVSHLDEKVKNNHTKIERR